MPRVCGRGGSGKMRNYYRVCSPRARVSGWCGFGMPFPRAWRAQRKFSEVVRRLFPARVGLQCFSMQSPASIIGDVQFHVFSPGTVRAVTIATSRHRPACLQMPLCQYGANVIRPSRLPVMVGNPVAFRRRFGGRFGIAIFRQ